MDSTAPVVREPAVDRPAITDPTTAILLRLRRDQNFALAMVVVLLGFVFLSALIIAWYGVSAAFVAHVVVMLLVIGLVGSKQYLWGRWLRLVRGPRLLTGSPWRAVPGKVLRARARSWASVVAVEENGVTAAVRVTALTKAHRAVIARTGRVWVVGPDESGWAALRVDGTHEALPARFLASVPSGVAEPQEGDPALLAARDLRFDALSLLVMLIPGCVAVFVLSAAAVGELSSALMAALGWLLLVGAAQLFSVRHTRVNLRLPGLVAGAVWTRVELSLAPWQARRDGTAKVRATVRLPEGGTRTLVMAAASVELLGTIWDTGAAWVSAAPEPGGVVAVGHPGYPPVSVARVAL